MTTINLKEFYPWYTHDEYIEVSEEVADELRASRLYEAAYQAPLLLTLDGSKIFQNIFHFLVYKPPLSVLISRG